MDNNSVYDIIEHHHLKDYAEYRDRFFISPAACTFTTGIFLVADDLARRIGPFINSKFKAPNVVGEDFTAGFFFLSIGAVLVTANFLKEQSRIKHAKYILEKNGISVSTHSLKKAKTVVYNIETTKHGITREYRGIIIEKRKKTLILKEVKNWFLEQEDSYEPRYSIEALLNNPNNYEEIRKIQKKIKYKYQK